MDVQELVFLSSAELKRMFVCASAVSPDQADLGKRERKKEKKKRLEIASASERAAFFGCNVLIESRWLQMQGPSAGDDTSLIF